MASVTIKHERFLPGMEVAAYPLSSVDVARRVGGVPGKAPTTSATVGADSELTITATAGTYALLAVTDERQTVTVDATAGEWTISDGTDTSDDLAFDVAEADVQTALEAFDSIAAGDVEVTGGPGDSGGTTPYVIRFTGPKSGTDVPELVVAEGGTPLTGGGAAVTIETTTPGSHATPNYVIAKTA